MYAVKEIFYTLQGEGANAGAPAVFCRFAGLQSVVGPRGGPRRRPTAGSAIRISSARTATAAASSPTADELARACAPRRRRPAGLAGRADRRRADAAGRRGADRCVASRTAFEIAIETNGTLPVPARHRLDLRQPEGRGAELRQKSGDELKLVFPAGGANAARLWPGCAFAHRYLQPMDGPDRARTRRRLIAYCKAHPAWRLSLQTHKLIGIP